VDLPGVLTIRTMDDALALRDRVGEGGHTVAVIGGGVLGLEIAYHLGRAGNQVVVLEFFSRLLPKQTDPESSTMFQHMLEGMGLNFHIEARTTHILGGDEGPEAVLLEDGRRIECDTVVICAGVRPTLKLSGRLGLEIGRGIVVDDRLRTGAPDVWAAGDLIEHRGVTYGIWQPAERQGEVAGTNMAGGEAVYEGTTISNTLKVVGVDLFAAGDIDPAGLRETLIMRDPSRGIYRKLVMAGGRIVGAILLGDTSDRKRVLRAIEGRRDVSETVDRLDWCDLCGLG
jgi:nitrite reductase (NADH) large subunit